MEFKKLTTSQKLRLLGLLFMGSGIGYGIADIVWYHLPIQFVLPILIGGILMLIGKAMKD